MYETMPRGARPVAGRPPADRERMDGVEAVRAATVAQSECQLPGRGISRTTDGEEA